MSNLAIFVILVFYQLQYHHCLVDIEKVTCKTYDKNFSRFDLCEIRRIKDKLPAVFIKIHLFQLPVTNCDVILALGFVSEKFSSIAFNTTWDACNFMKNTKRYRSLLRFYNVISNFTDLNHSCPYNHDIHITNVPAVRLVFPIPVPNGNYLIKMQFMVDKKLRLAVDLDAKRN